MTETKRAGSSCWWRGAHPRTCGVRAAGPALLGRVLGRACAHRAPATRVYYLRTGGPVLRGDQRADAQSLADKNQNLSLQCPEAAPTRRARVRAGHVFNTSFLLLPGSVCRTQFIPNLSLTRRPQRRPPLPPAAPARRSRPPLPPALPAPAAPPAGRPARPPLAAPPPHRRPRTCAWSTRDAAVALPARLSACWPLG
jgi:hypothetical protein